MINQGGGLLTNDPSGSSSGSSGSSVAFPEYPDFESLPTAATEADKAYVLSPSGAMFTSERKHAGLYRFNGTEWIFLGNQFKVINFHEVVDLEDELLLKQSKVYAAFNVIIENQGAENYSIGDILKDQNGYDYVVRNDGTTNYFENTQQKVYANYDLDITTEDPSIYSIGNILKDADGYDYIVRNDGTDNYFEAITAKQEESNGGEIIEEYATFDDLPVDAEEGTKAFVITATGSIFTLSRKKAGTYRYDGTAWQYLGNLITTIEPQNVIGLEDILADKQDIVYVAIKVSNVSALDLTDFDIGDFIKDANGHDYKIVDDGSGTKIAEAVSTSEGPDKPYQTSSTTTNYIENPFVFHRFVINYPERSTSETTVTDTDNNNETTTQSSGEDDTTDEGFKVYEPYTPYTEQYAAYVPLTDSYEPYTDEATVEETTT